MRNMFSKKQHTDEEILELLNKGHLAHQERRFSDAITNLQQATDYIIETQRLTDQLFNARLNLGVNYKRIGNITKAYESYKSLVGKARTPEDEYSLHSSLGKVCYLLGYDRQAIDSYVITLRLTGGQDLDMLHHLGHTLIDLDPSQNLNAYTKGQVKEYQKMLMGEPHAYDIGLASEYIEIAKKVLNI